MLNAAIGHTIRDLRQKKKYSLRQLSMKSCVSMGYISDIERGEKSASEKVLEAIASGLSLTTTELIGEIYEYLKEQSE
jgi:transcriptional regulator with XRE-family HTH domain